MDLIFDKKILIIIWITLFEWDRHHSH